MPQTGKGCLLWGMTAVAEPKLYYSKKGNDHTVSTVMHSVGSAK
jgi:hypothetical protein